MGKPVIYHVIVRLFGNTNEFCIPNSSLEINGCGKFNDFTSARLHSIKELGCSHIWFTGVIEHSTLSDFSPTATLQATIATSLMCPCSSKSFLDVG